MKDWSRLRSASKGRWACVLCVVPVVMQHDMKESAGEVAPLTPLCVVFPPLLNNAWGERVHALNITEAVLLAFTSNVTARPSSLFTSHLTVRLRQHSLTACYHRWEIFLTLTWFHLERLNIPSSYLYPKINVARVFKKCAQVDKIHYPPLLIKKICSCFKYVSLDWAELLEMDWSWLNYLKGGNSR